MTKWVKEQRCEVWESCNRDGSPADDVMGVELSEK